MVTPVDQRRWNSWSTEDLPWNVTGIVFTISLLIGCFSASALAAQPPNASTASHEAANHELSVPVTGFSFSGNAAIGEEELLSLIEDAIGGELTLADLEALSDRIGDYYRGQGYLLARAYLPPQTIEGGRVQIAVDEGRYGDVFFENQSRLHPDTARQVFRSLKPGTAIRRQPLERSLRLVSDLPGVRVHSVLRPGTSPGTSDLIVALEDGPMLTGRVAVDNHGNRYAGHNRLSFQLALENPWGRARRITLGGVSSGTELRSGALTYEAGLGGNGLRAEISYSLVEYRLGGAMAQLDATGRVESFSASLRYPWIRSEAANWIGRIEASAASLRDGIGSVDLVTQKGVYKLMLSISGDRAMGRAGRAGGSITLTYGDLSLKSADAQAIDAGTAQTAGRFARLGFSGQFSQSLGTRWIAEVSARGQLASKNLDGSEKFSLGGAAGVRAYPAGEAAGDQGWFGRLALRRLVVEERGSGSLSVQLFAESGRVQRHHTPYAGSGDPNFRSLSGAGVGMTWRRGAWSLDVVGAVPVGSEDPTSDVSVPVRWWLQAAWTF